MASQTSRAGGGAGAAVKQQRYRVGNVWFTSETDKSGPGMRMFGKIPGPIFDTDDIEEVPEAERSYDRSSNCDELISAKFPGHGKYWVTYPWERRPLRVRGHGLSAARPQRLVPLFRATAEKMAKRDIIALRVKRNNVWRDIPWADYYQTGVKRFDPVAMLGFNSPEWFYAGWGTVMAGGVITGIYTTNSPEACRYILDHSEAAMVLVDTQRQLDKILEVYKSLPKLKAIVMWLDPVPEGAPSIVTSFDEWMARGDAVSDAQLQLRIDEQEPEDCFALIYTSGTTGPPKAVMVSQDSITWMAKTLLPNFIEIEPYNDTGVSYLPLSHVAAMLLDMIGPGLHGGTLSFAQPDALRGRSLHKTLLEVRPTLFLGVPRVWEKMHENIMAETAWLPAPIHWIRNLAKSIGLRDAETRFNDMGDSTNKLAFLIADLIIFRILKWKLGLNNTKLCATAAAPIQRSTLDYFMSVNVNLFEIYGMSESTGVIALNRPGFCRPGSIGQGFPGSEVRIADPDENGEGEICTRGRHVFMGYYKDPASTAEVIDAEGWLHTGDIGFMDKDGYLTITGRKKELIITAGGENVPPVLIEKTIKTQLPAISNCMVIGDMRKYLTCLITFKAVDYPDAKHNEYEYTDELVPQARQILQAHGANVSKVSEAVADHRVHQYVQQGIDAANKAAISNAQTVRKFVLLSHDFSQGTGELTPTMKLKRKFVLAKYAKEIDGMYAE